MLELKSFQVIFPTPIFKFEVKDFERLNQQLIQECYVIKAEQKGVQRSNMHGWHSNSDLLLRQDPAIKILREHIVDGLYQAIRKLSPGVETSKLQTACDAWININSPKAFNLPHSHTGHTLSGCYYVQVPVSEMAQDEASIEFLDPRRDVVGAALPGSPYSIPRITISPKPGDMLIFPSYLWHWVMPNFSEEDRISIAFNALIKINN